MCAHEPTDSCYPVSSWFERRWAVLVVIKPDVARVISPVRTFTPFSQSQSDVWQLFTYFLWDWLSMPGSIKPCEFACSHSLYCDMVGKRNEWPNGEKMKRERGTQTNEWVSWTVMRCFIHAIGKLLFCLLEATGRSDLLYFSLPETGQVSWLLTLQHYQRFPVWWTLSLIGPPISNSAWETEKVLNCLITNVNLCFLFAARDPDDRPRDCRVWQRAGHTTCCPTAVWCMLGSCLLQVTTQDLS